MSTSKKTLKLIKRVEKAGLDLLKHHDNLKRDSDLLNKAAQTTMKAAEKKAVQADKALAVAQKIAVGIV